AHGRRQRCASIVGPSIRSSTSASSWTSSTRGTGYPWRRTYCITNASPCGSPPDLNRRSTRPSPRSKISDARPDAIGWRNGLSARDEHEEVVVPRGSGVIVVAFDDDVGEAGAFEQAQQLVLEVEIDRELARLLGFERAVAPLLRTHLIGDALR